jgi:hypothetical protein
VKSRLTPETDGRSTSARCATFRVVVADDGARSRELLVDCLLAAEVVPHRADAEALVSNADLDSVAVLV